MGLYDVYGNVWEWTEDHFNGLPGFKTLFLYEDFSTPSFDGRHNMIMVRYGCNTVKLLNSGHFGGQYKFSCCVLCREVVLFSEVQNVLELYSDKLFGTLKSILCPYLGGSTRGFAVRLTNVFPRTWHVKIHCHTCPNIQEIAKLRK